jgi:hypothetical protein
MFAPRGLDQLKEDFKKTAGDFIYFYNGMDSREKLLFKSWIHRLRVEAYSPLADDFDQNPTKLF